MKRPVLAALLAALTTMPAAAQTQGLEKIDRRIWVAPDGYIRLFDMAGSIRVVGWDRDTLAITGTMTLSGDAEFVVSPGKQGAKVSIWGAANGTARGDLVVRVPRKSQVWIKTQEASVSVSEFEGGLDIFTFGGSVEVTGRPREVYAESMGGDINLSVTTRSVRIKTGAGNITVRGGIDDASVASVSGAIFIVDARIKQALFESIEGKISYQGELLTPGRLEFTNHAGDVELVLSPKVSGEFSISTIEGTFRDEFGVRLRYGVGKLKGKEFSFTIGRVPDNEVSIRTFKGHVILKKIGFSKKAQ